MHFDVWYERPAATEECHGGMCVDVDRILGKSWWPDVCHLSQGAHTPYTLGIPWVKSPERVLKGSKKNKKRIKKQIFNGDQ